MAREGMVGLDEQVVDRAPMGVVDHLDQAEAIVHGLDQRVIRLFQPLPQQVVGGDIVADHQHAMDAGLDLDRAVAIGPPHVFAAAVAGQRDQAVLVPGTGSVAHDALDVRSDQVPGLFPAGTAGLAEGGRMALRAQSVAVAVVIELDQLVAPPDEHRVIARQQQPQQGLQGRGPAVGRAERTVLPIVGAHESDHLAAAGQEGRTRFQHRQSVVYVAANDTA